MDQQKRHNRRSEPLHYSLSSSPETIEPGPSRTSFEQKRVWTGSNLSPLELASSPTDYLYASPDEQNVQTRLLQSRRTRFRGLPIVPRNITPVAGAELVNTNRIGSSQDTMSSSPFDIGLKPPLRRLSNDLGILQEVSNSSLRRKRSKAHDTMTLSQIHDMQRPEEDTTKQQPFTNFDSKPVTTAAGITTIAANSSQPLRSDPTRTPRARNKPVRLLSPYKATPEDDRRYIEHLESQLAALQTQLQSLTSPSTTKTHSAKLRAVTTESRVLRQEVEEWERKFHDRVSEQLVQHDLLVASLRMQIKQLGRELEATKERVQEMVAECSDKDRQITEAEGANYDLERRLEFMSELLALSPTKSKCSDMPLETKRISAPRPSSSSHFRPTAANLRQVSPPRRSLSRPLSQDYSAMTPDSPTRSSLHYSREINPFENLRAEPSDTESVTESESVLSHSVAGSARLPFSGRRSINSNLTSEDETRVRPTRRMRRFYTGAMGPRSLILPATTNSERQLLSTPREGTQTPPLSSVYEGSSGYGQGLGFKLPISPERRLPLHARAATWDENEASARKLRRPSAVHDSPLPLLQPVFAFGGSFTPTDDGFPQLHKRVTSIGPLPTKNLFEELSRIRSDIPNSSQKSGEDSEIPTQLSNCLVVDGEQQDSLIESIPVLQEQTAATPVGPTVAVNTEVEDFANAQTVIDTQAPPTTTNTDQALPTCKPPPELPPLREPSLFNRILTFISYTLAPSTPTMRNVLANAWSLVTLSRPVLEFRWWLVRLLVGGLQRKRQLRILATQGSSAAARGLGVTSAQNMLVSGIDTRNVGVLFRRPRSGSDLSLLSNESDGADSVPSIDAGDGEDADDEDEDRRGCRGRLLKVDANAVCDTSRPEVVDIPQMPRPVAWLKFSMTLVFAVGVAIRDGPATLFRPVHTTDLRRDRKSEGDDGGG